MLADSCHVIDVKAPWHSGVILGSRTATRQPVGTKLPAANACMLMVCFQGAHARY